MYSYFRFGWFNFFFGFSSVRCDSVIVVFALGMFLPLSCCVQEIECSCHFWHCFYNGFNLLWFSYKVFLSLSLSLSFFSTFIAHLIQSMGNIAIGALSLYGTYLYVTSSELMWFWWQWLWFCRHYSLHMRVWVSLWSADESEIGSVTWTKPILMFVHCFTILQTTVQCVIHSKLFACYAEWDKSTAILLLFTVLSLYKSHDNKNQSRRNMRPTKKLKGKWIYLSFVKWKPLREGFCISFLCCVFTHAQSWSSQLFKNEPFSNGVRHDRLFTIFSGAV